MTTQHDQYEYPFQDPELPIGKRVEDLLGRLSLEEKIPQLLYNAPAIERLGIPAHNWWNECLHGVGRSGVATVFPQAIGLAATFDPDFIHTVADKISDEARAKHHEAVRRGDFGIYKGLSYWTPNINIFRDPRWGRGQETYGECPWLTGRIGRSFVEGLQGNDPRYLKLVATPKHFAVHSGPEALRHEFDAIASPKDLYETYLPAFRELIVEGGAWSVMSAYNRTNGEACSASETLLVKILREDWKFKGYVVSDCWAIEDIYKYHGLAKTRAEAAAMAIKAGCDLNCGTAYTALGESVQEGLLTEADIDKCLARLIEARVRLGMFDPPERVPYSSVPFDVVDSDEHRELSREAARRSIVLLKNQNNTLPLSKKIGTVAVIGPNAYDTSVLLGNYNGTPTKTVTPLDGIRSVIEENGGRVIYSPGCMRAEREENVALGHPDRFIPEAVGAAEKSDAVILVLGLSSDLEGEQGDASNADASGDRVSIGLPGAQQELLERIAAVGKPTVLVILCGSAVAVPWAETHIPAILQAWYPGQEGGNGIADVIFGDCNPAGRLPITVYRDLEQLPPFEDYSMEGRTYRYINCEPLYPFGYGLSYTTFRYCSLEFSAPEIAPGETITISAEIENTGDKLGDEVVQLYLRDASSRIRKPHHQLRGVKRIQLKPGEIKKVLFTLTARDMALITESGKSVVEPGTFEVFLGGRQPDLRSQALSGSQILQGSFEVQGSLLELDP